MKDRNEWIKTVTPNIKRNMAESASAAYRNGCELYSDALHLYNLARFPRAAALAILAEEEFSKAFILLNCATNARWDSSILKSLRTHSNKQAISEAMLVFYDWLVENKKRVESLNKFALIPSYPSINPSPEMLEHILNTGKEILKKPIRDFFKQDCFYVAIDDEAKLTSEPNKVSKTEAEKSLNVSEKFQTVVKTLMDSSLHSE